ncbi:MAG: glycosyltransferase [Pseudomonadota bacterium]
MTTSRIGLRIFANSAWLGGVNYVLGWARLLQLLPEKERPYIVFLYTTEESHQVAQDNAHLCDEIAQFTLSGSQNLDMVYPATQLAEVPMNTPWAGWIPDWQCQHLPELFDDQEKTRRRVQYHLLAQHSAVCVCSSQQGMDDTEAQLPHADKTLFKLHFPANIADADFDHAETLQVSAREKYNLPEEYLLICNQFWRHKNHLAVLRCVKKLGDRSPTVVMTGAIQDTRWPEYKAEVEGLLADPEVLAKVIVTGQITREEQLGILFGARGLIQPSLFEGWSSFVEEGRATGKAIILSDIPVHREQNPPGCVFFDTEHPDQLERAMANWCDLPVQPLTQARQAHREFSIQCARQFLDLSTQVRDRWSIENDAKVIAADQLASLHTEIGTTLEQTDFDLFAAGVRQLFRDYPQDLARLAHLICQDDHPLSSQAPALILLATMRKAGNDFTKAFFDHDPWQDPWLEQLQEQSDKSPLSLTKHLTLRSVLLSRELLHTIRSTLERKLDIS